MPVLDFQAFNARFFELNKDLGIYDCKDFNAFKIVQEGLKVKYSEKGNIRCAIFYASWIYRIYRFFNALKHKKTEGFKQKDFLILDTGRIVKQEKKYVSLYFDKIIARLGLEHCFVFFEHKKHKDIDLDLDMNAMLSLSARKKLDAQDKDLIKQIKQLLHRLEQHVQYSKSELLDIRIAFQLFVDKYLGMKALLSMIHPKKAIITCHYHKEGFLLALKQTSIQVHELQHGIVSENDIFYCYKNLSKHISKRALFADYFWTFGPYWTNLLKQYTEFSSQRLKEIGLYTQTSFTDQHSKEKIDHLLKNCTCILMTTQTYLHDYFIDYATFLAEHLDSDEYVIVLKTHPAESTQTYQKSLAQFSNVFVLSEDLQYLFERAQVHISIYSTTLFEALKYKHITNYALYIDEFKGYVDVILKDQIALKLMPDQLPDFTEHSQNQAQMHNHFFSSLNLDKFVEAISE